MMTYVALPYQMYQLTRSSAAVGLLGLAELVPLLVTAFLGGALADSVDRRRRVVVTEAALGACSLSLALLARGSASPAILYIVAGTMSAINGLQRPSMDSLVPRLVAREELTAAAALGTLRGSLGMIAGPALGGLLIASFGLAPAYGVDVASYAVALACLAAMAPVPAPEGMDRPSLGAMIQGLRYAWSRQELVGTYLVDFLAMVFGMPLALFPALSDHLGGPPVLGWLYAAPAVGALAASFTGGLAARVKRHGVGVMVAATVWGLAIVLFGLCDSLWPACAWLAIAGGADAVSGIFRITMWHGSIPDALRGRMAGIEMISYMSGPLLGHVEAGLVGAAFGVRASVVSGGVLCVIGVLLCGVLLPGLVRYRDRGGTIPATL
jgi:MFS family permease